MKLRRTLSALTFPTDTAYRDLPVEWAKGVAVQILGWMWLSFDRLKANHLAGVDIGQPIDQLERGLTFHHFIDLQVLVREQTEGFSSLIPVHECEEFESLSSGGARPPSYDFGFVHVEHRRWIWPIEAKVLPTPGLLHDYLGDVRNKFESGVAAPLVGEGGMIAYLLSGSTDAVFLNLQEHLASRLETVHEYEGRPHRTSFHMRSTAPALRLHHMVMVCY
ncbi:MAG TPA: hypothetical protein VGM86_30145 [Thermoanaerobaculia bacterium]